MKIARFSWRDQIRWGVVQGEMLYALEGSLWQDMRPGPALCPVSEVRLLAPLEPTNKVIGCGLTFRRMWERYQFHNGPQHRDGPAIFMKQPTTNIGPLDPIVYPEVAEQVIYEAEVGVVLGRKAKNVSADKALEYVGGYTCVNDVTANAMKTTELPIVSTRFKLFDTFCPIGPVIETDLDPCNAEIICRINGREVMRGNTRDLVISIAEQIAWVSTVMTLYPGDIICTGSPAVGPIRVGDMVEVEVEGIGVLRNPVVVDDHDL